MQEHCLDLRRLPDEPTPVEADPTGGWHCFERGASKLGGGKGWADVWKRGCFGWEYKGKRHDLKVAYVQLQQYAVALKNSPRRLDAQHSRHRLRHRSTGPIHGRKPSPKLLAT